MAKIAIFVGTGQLVRCVISQMIPGLRNWTYQQDFRTLSIRKMAIKSMLMAVMMAPKHHMVFDRSSQLICRRNQMDRHQKKRHQIHSLACWGSWSPPHNKIELSVKPKCKVKLELWWEIVRRECIPMKRGIHNKSQVRPRRVRPVRWQIQDC